MELLDQYFKTQKKLYDYFGYSENWVVIPVDDRREYYWYLEGEGPGEVHYADTEDDLKNYGDNYYVDDIYTQRFLSKWVYVGKDFTMIAVDTHTDGNKFLAVYDNTKRLLELPHLAE